MSDNRLEGTMKLTPALGQQKLYLLVFTTQKDLQQTTQMVDPAKAYAKGNGNAVPDIPDPIARHGVTGSLAVKASTSSSSSILGSARCLVPPARSPWEIRRRQPIAPASTRRRAGCRTCACSEKRTDAQRYGELF